MQRPENEPEPPPSSSTDYARLSIFLPLARLSPSRTKNLLLSRMHRIESKKVGERRRVILSVNLSSFYIPYSFCSDRSACVIRIVRDPDLFFYFYIILYRI